MRAKIGIGRSKRVGSGQRPGRWTRDELPAADCSVPPTEERDPGEREHPGRGAVLVADDDEAVRMVACGLLEILGFGVLTATDGLEAVTVFREHQDRIVAVLLDVAMPRLDGLGALRELRRIRPDVRVILCTGYSEVEARARHGDAPVEAYLAKPYSLDVLRERLRAVLKG